MKEELLIEGIPAEVKKLVEKIKTRKEQKDFVFDMCGMPEKLAEALLPFQMDGVAWVSIFWCEKKKLKFGKPFRFAQQNDGKCIICDEMGLGKTIQAIAISSCYCDDW